VLAILDPRLRTKPYGRRFLTSLPPAPVVGDLARVAAFMSSDAPAWRLSRFRDWRSVRLSPSGWKRHLPRSRSTIRESCAVRRPSPDWRVSAVN